MTEKLSKIAVKNLQAFNKEAANTSKYIEITT